MNRDVNFSGIRFFEEWRWSSCCSLTFYCKLFCTNWTVLTGWDFFLVFCLRQITHALSRDFKKGGNEIKLLILNLREIYTIVKNFFLKVSILDSRSDSLSNSSFLFFSPPPLFLRWNHHPEKKFPQRIRIQKEILCIFHSGELKILSQYVQIELCHLDGWKIWGKRVTKRYRVFYSYFSPKWVRFARCVY